MTWHHIIPAAVPAYAEPVNHDSIVLLSAKKDCRYCPSCAYPVPSGWADHTLPHRCPPLPLPAFQVNHDSVVFHSAQNDCCCHVAVSKQTIPLEKIQDVQLQEGCWETCFSLKTIDVQTAGGWVHTFLDSTPC